MTMGRSSSGWKIPMRKVVISAVSGKGHADTLNSTRVRKASVWEMGISEGY